MQSINQKLLKKLSRSVYFNRYCKEYKTTKYEVVYSILSGDITIKDLTTILRICGLSIHEVFQMINGNENIQINGNNNQITIQKDPVSVE